MSRETRRRKPKGKDRPHWCKLCRGQRYVYGQPIVRDVGRGPEEFTAVTHCPTLTGSVEPEVDRKRRAAGEKEGA